MSTPPLSDEEFDALFRQGLERYPELPDDPAAWLGLELRLDAAARASHLRRRVLRLLGGETILLAGLAWGLLQWVEQAVAPAGPSATTTRHPAPGQPGDRPALTPLPTASQSAGSSSRRPGATTSSATGAVPTPTDAMRVTEGATAAVGSGRLAPAAASAAGATPALAYHRPPREQKKRGVAVAAMALPPHRQSRGPIPASDADEGRAASSHTGRRRAGAELALAARSRPAVKSGGARLEVTATRSAPDLSATPALNQAAFNRASAALGQRRRRLLAHQSLAGPRPAPTGPDRQPAHAGRQDQAAGYLASAGRYTQSWAPGRTATPAAEPATQLNQPSDPNLLAAPLPDRMAQPGAARPAGEELLAGRPGSLLPPPSGLPAPLALLPVAADPPVLPSSAPDLGAYRLRVGLLGAPELSTVSLDYAPGLGWNAGGYLDYRVGQRWHLSAGYLLTLKRYAAEGYDYHAPPDYQHPKWVIRDVDAVCRIVDLPLSVRYDAWQRPNQLLYASVGTSSLLMRNERYTYYYDDLNGKPLAPTFWEVPNGSQHYFKVLSFSAGYERALSRRWSVQAEPFVKLPLAGVGYGQVRLASAGVYLSLRYGLLLTRPATPAP